MRTGTARTGDHKPLTLDAALRSTCDRLDTSAFFFDFDGTLSPMVEDPDAAQPAPGILAALTALGERVPNVAIVSARPVQFLLPRFPGLPHVTFFGLYGLEVLRGDSGELETDDAAAGYLDTIAALAERARAEVPAPVLVEYKRLSVALHYRTAPHLREQVERWSRERADEYGLRLQGGRMVVDLKPSIERDKGSVVRDETEGLSCAWFFGDDLADLDAFAALDDREAADDGFVGVRVAVANPETGQELTGAADIHVDGPAGVPPLLAEVTAYLSR